MLVDGKGIALDTREKLKQEINALKKAPKLFIISVGKDLATEKFINQKKKFGFAIGITIEENLFDEQITTDRLVEHIGELKKSVDTL